MDSYNMGFMMAFQDPNRENSTVCRIAISGVYLSLGSGRISQPGRVERRQQLLWK